VQAPTADLQAPTKNLHAPTAQLHTTTTQLVQKRTSFNGETAEKYACASQSASSNWGTQQIRQHVYLLEQKGAATRLVARVKSDADSHCASAILRCSSQRRY
jgi:hypothetical protein